METIDPRRLLVKIAKILDRWQIPYLVTGGMAVSVLGRPRFTADIDVVIEMTMKDVKNLAHSLQILDEAGYVDEDAMIDALKKEGEFNFIDGESGMKVDFWILKNDEFDKSRLKRRKEEKILDYGVSFSSPEDLILSKLLWAKASGSARQMDDIESVMKISGDKLDKKYLKIWAIKLGVSDILEDLMQ